MIVIWGGRKALEAQAGREVGFTVFGEVGFFGLKTQLFHVCSPRMCAREYSVSSCLFGSASAALVALEADPVDVDACYVST